MRNFHVYILALVITLFGLGVFAYKWLIAGFPLTPGARVSAWQVERKISFEAAGGPAKLSINVPGNTSTQKVVAERVVAPRFGTTRQESGGNRQVILAARNITGPQIVFVRTIVFQIRSRDAMAPEAAPRISRRPLSEAQQAVAQDVLAAAEAKSADDTTLVAAVLKQLISGSAAGSIHEAASRSPASAVRADAAVKVLALKNIAARRVNGIELGGSRQHVPIVHWLEAFVDGGWRSYSVDSGDPGVPDSYFPWWRGTASPARLEGGSNLRSQISMSRLEQGVLDELLARGKTKRDELVTFSLFGLPLATQEVYRILLVIPLGIFLLVILRNVVGLRHLGTFMPVLIAIAFRETKLVWGIILFVSVVGSGLVFRFYLEHLKLLLVPRLASVLIFVLLLMAVVSSATNALGFEHGLSVALFPMVIMTMTIERVSVIWDERGPAEALTQAFGSLLIAVVCYVIMTRELVEHIFFTFPELLLVLLAGTLLLGRYTGYRLLELRRFQVLAGKDG